MLTLFIGFNSHCIKEFNVKIFDGNFDAKKIILLIQSSSKIRI